MYFKGIIKNNETNFLACRIIGFVALIFLSLFLSHSLSPSYHSFTRSLSLFLRTTRAAHYADVIAKSSFPLSGFFIIFIHFRCTLPLRVARGSFPSPPPSRPPPTPPAAPTTRERYFFLCSTPGISLRRIIATNKIVKFRQIYAVHYFLLLCPSRL